MSYNLGGRSVKGFNLYFEVLLRISLSLKIPIYLIDAGESSILLEVRLLILCLSN